MTSVRSVVLCAALFGAACAPRPPALPGPGTEPPIMTYEKEVLAAISGESEIGPGTKLANRFTIENKRLVRDIATQLVRAGLVPERQPYATLGR